MPKFAKSGGIFEKFVKCQDGVFSAWSLFLVICCLMIGGLAVDHSYGVMTRAKLQAASDAAALAAVQELPDIDAATAAGLEIANMHFDATEGQPIKASHFVFGKWNPTTEVVDAGATPIDAVQVVATRTQGNGNALPTFLLGLVGVNTFDVVTGTIAAGLPDLSCKNGGFFTEQNIISGSNNAYLDGFCLYGRLGVKIGSDNNFENGVRVEMLDENDFEQGGNNGGINDALAQIQDAYNLSLPRMVPDVVDTMLVRQTHLLPEYMQGWNIVEIERIEDTTPIAPYTIYIVEHVADFGSYQTIRDVAVVAAKEVKVGSNNWLYNVFFATMDKVLVGSNNIFEHPSDCGYGRYSTYLFSGSNIEFGSANEFTGVQMAAMNEIKLGSDVKGVKDVYAEALGNFDYGSADTFAGCPGGLISDVGPGPARQGSGQFSAIAIVR